MIFAKKISILFVLNEFASKAVLKTRLLVFFFSMLSYEKEHQCVTKLCKLGNRYCLIGIFLVGLQNLVTFPKFFYINVKERILTPKLNNAFTSKLLLTQSNLMLWDDR